MAKKKMLVAGASGLVGFAAVQHFAQLADWDVVGVSRRIPPGLEGATLLSVDLMDKAHCAEAFSELRDVTYYTDDTVTLHHGDCIEVMRGMADGCVDAIVTDPPYGLGFMGRAWDALPPGYDFAVECLRVLKPGGHMLAFGGTRTWHRLAVAIEDAGFEIRDSIAWMYGSGFPKSLDVSKAIDKAAGAREHVGKGFVTAGDYNGRGLASPEGNYVDPPPATADAVRWQGWGTALKPAFEPIVVARKPLNGTVAANVLAYGTGALNIDGGRVQREPDRASGWSKSGSKAGPNDSMSGDNYDREGRWPANVILDESQIAELDRQSGVQSGGQRVEGKVTGTTFGSGSTMPDDLTGVLSYGDSGGASRFFYTAKANTHERPRIDGSAHPTVKPLTLMRYLVRLVTPPGGIVLEPFAGSGTTLEACIVEGFKCIGIERDPTYLDLIVQRVSKPIQVTLL